MLLNSGGLPYVADSDTIADYPAASLALADAITRRSGLNASGNITVTPPANTNTNYAVTFPAGRFTVPPDVAVTAQANSPSVVFTCIGVAPTVTGVSIMLFRTTATATLLRWLAHSET